jgi:hypothetical protein
VKHPDQVLAMRGIDPGLPTHGRIHLRKQAGRHLHEAHSAPDNARGKARQITDHAAAKRQHNIATLKPRAQNVVANLHQLIEPLGLLTRFQHQRHCASIPSAARLSIRRSRWVAATLRSVITAHRILGLSRPDLRTGARDQSWPNEDIVAALAKIDADCFM